MKVMTKTGASRATQHKSVITSDDLKNSSFYFQASPFSPLVLRRCVWFNLSVHLISRGLEFITNSVKILSIFYLMNMINNTLFFAMKHSKRIFKEASAVMKLLLIREIMLFQSVLLVLLKCFGFFCPKLINMRQTFSMLV